MDKLQQIFVTEALELIADLEKALLAFEADLSNLTSVQEIFRVMHTLKGSASMFGFDSISEITHDVETIYDLIRDSKKIATNEILDVTLDALDHLKNLIADPLVKDEVNQRIHAELLSKLKSLLSENEETSGVQKELDRSGVQTFYISFAPDINTLKNGTNPLYLVEDITTLGKCIVLPHMDEVPDFDQLSPDSSYATFEILLVTEKGEQEIRDVFIFVEDSVKLVVERIANYDLIAVDEFRSALTASPSVGNAPFGLEIVKAFVGKGDATSTNKAHVFAKVDSTSIRVSSDKLDELMNLVSELVTSQARLSLLADKYSIPELGNVTENMEKITRRLRDNAFSICLVPIESLVVRFQRLVRDLSKELNKEIEFTSEGTETELDKSIIEKVTDPILHILRNCIDHAIELPEERVQQQKPRSGKIHLKAFHSGTSVIVKISDDGRGLNFEKIREKAIAKGLLSAEAEVTESQLIDIVFSPGFSTSDKITDVSGRGVGMDVVKRNIEAIHGEVSLETKRGQGTVITIKLPLTLSIMDGMLVAIKDANYILPLSAIDKCYELSGSRMKDDLSQKHVFDGELLPVFSLQKAFSETTTIDSQIIQVIKIRRDGIAVGLTVDHIIGEYQAVLKPLGELYRDHDEYSGATVLGDGTVALVLDTEKLIKKLMAAASLNAA